MEPAEIFGKAWDILVDHAGAVPNPRERTSFIYAFLAKKHPAMEWRFQGSLGFGGKFWRHDGKYYISCYSEDQNKKRAAIIEKVNTLLVELPYFYPEPE